MPNLNLLRIGAVYLIVLLHVADASIANVSIYSIALDLHFDTLDGQRIVTAFGVGMATAVPFVPRLSRWLGPRAATGWALVVSMLSILACGLAPNYPALVAARAVQGLSSVAVVLLCQRLLLDFVGEPQRAFGLGLWTSAIAIAPVLGPVIGALTVQAAGWRALFVLQVPLLALCCAAVFAQLGLRREGDGPRPSAGVFVAFAAMAALLQLAGDRIAELEAPWLLLGAAAVAAACLKGALRAAHETLFNWRLLASPTLLRCLGMVAMLNGIALLTGLIYPLWLQSTFHLTILEVAQILAAGGLVAGTLSPLIGKLKDKRRYPLFVALGMVAFALSFALCTRLTAASSMLQLTLPRVFLGLGIGLCSPLGYLAVAHLDKSQVLEANSIGMLLRAVVANVVLVAGTLGIRWMTSGSTGSGAASAMTGGLHGIFAAAVVVMLGLLAWHVLAGFKGGAAPAAAVPKKPVENA